MDIICSLTPLDSVCNTNLWVTMIGLVIQESARHVPNPSPVVDAELRFQLSGR